MLVADEILPTLLADEPDFVPSKRHVEQTVVETFHRDMIQRSWLDFNAPYQRQDDAWNRKFKQAFILSCFNKLPIPPLHFVSKRKTGHQRWCMDGKQRSLTLADFLADKFAVRLLRNDPTPLLWSDIQDREDLSALAYQFMSCPLTYVDWEPMDMMTQKKIFSQINHSSSLNTQERIYCPNFLTRMFLKYVFNNCLKDLKPYFRGSVQYGRRFSDVRVVHGLMIVCFGYQFEEGFGVRSLRVPAIIRSAQSLHYKLNEAGFRPSSDAEITPMMLTRIDGLLDKLDTLASYSEALAQVIGKLPERRYEAKGIVDTLAFLMSIEDLNPDDIVQNAEGFAAVFKDYTNGKSKEDSSRNTTDINSLKRRLALLARLYQKYL